jgi:hypothetical protein
MITPEQVAEIAPHYEEYMCAEDPGSPEVLTARLLFQSACKKVYDAESEEMRTKWTLEASRSTFIVPEINRYLNQRTSKFPTVQPEKAGE